MVILSPSSSVQVSLQSAFPLNLLSLNRSPKSFLKFCRKPSREIPPDPSRTNLLNSGAKLPSTKVILNETIFSDILAIR